MDIPQDIFNTFKFNEHFTTVWLYPAEERVDDPEENTTIKTFLNPIAIQAVVKSLTPESLRWKFHGTLPMGSKQLICEKKYKVLFKLAKKIIIDGEHYKTWIDDKKGFGIIDREAYIVVILETKSENEDE